MSCPFLLESQNNFAISGDQPAPGITGQYLDMVEVANWDGNSAHPYPSVALRTDFRRHEIGDFVFHCHILGPEDLGMMNILQVASQNKTANTKASKKISVLVKTSGPTTAITPLHAPTAGMESMKLK